MPQSSDLKLNDLIRTLVGRLDSARRVFRIVFENGPPRKMTILSVYADFFVAYENIPERTEIISFGAVSSLMVLDGDAAKIDIAEEVRHIAKTLMEGEKHA